MLKGGSEALALRVWLNPFEYLCDLLDVGVDLLDLGVDLLDLGVDHLRFRRLRLQDDPPAEKLARSFWFLPGVEVQVLFSSTLRHDVCRIGFHVTHANFLTSTASQGLTLRKGTMV